LGAGERVIAAQNKTLGHFCSSHVSAPHIKCAFPQPRLSKQTIAHSRGAQAAKFAYTRVLLTKLDRPCTNPGGIALPEIIKNVTIYTSSFKIKFQSLPFFTRAVTAYPSLLTGQA